MDSPCLMWVLLKCQRFVCCCHILVLWHIGMSRRIYNPMNINQSVSNWPDGECERTIILGIHYPQNGSCLFSTVLNVWKLLLVCGIQCNSEWTQRILLILVIERVWGKVMESCLSLKAAGASPVFCLIQLLGPWARNTWKFIFTFFLSTS